MICGSFAKKAGNFGMQIHNGAARALGLDFYYQSFPVENIEEAIKSMRLLKFRGVGISMPFKTEVLKFVDVVTPEAEQINAANTIVNDNGLIAYNTDWIAAYILLKELNIDKTINVLGNGGYAKAVIYAVNKLGLNHNVYTRRSWGLIKYVKDSVIFNCTPVENIEMDKSNVFIDCNLNSESGKKLAFLQAKEQFKLYTGIDYPNDIVY